MEKQDILMVGVGGQGTILASDILGDVALAAKYDVKKTDTLGMAQRGGSVISHVRLAKKVWSPMIKEGEVDILLAFEKLEAARWAHFLKPGGLALVNNHANPPLSVSLGTHRYPNDNEVREILKQRTDKIYLVEGTASAKEMGDVRTLNLFMLGCISNFMSIKPNVWQKCIAERLPAKILQLNLKAFEQGRKETSHVNL
ncbi:MAG: indolepyruvate oxidoreductase subunit beta [Chloroflexi bacterium]|nr:indolepyruvate oxidoreductase subunit beta [Chloroflexota bacterium]MBM4453919.1 indolepyruvate oxidoreductase subunit beta [Chloroflexota bacterium]